MADDKSLVAINKIRNAGSITRQALSQEMEISLSLANKLTAGLLSAGLIEKTHKKEEQEAGRPADVLSLRADWAVTVGLDIGDGVQIAAVTDLRGRIISSRREVTPMPADRDAALRHLTGLIERAVAQAGRRDRPVLGVGMALHGIVDALSGTVDGWEDGLGWLAPWIGRSLRDALSGVVDYPFILVDDIVRALGIAESLHGKGRRDRDFVYLYADTGIGMSFLQAGKPYIGYSHIAGELAHVPVDPQEWPCVCGSRGCLGAAISTEAIRTRVRQRLAESPVRSALRDRSDQATIQEIVQTAAAGDKLAIRIMTEAGEYMGKAIAIVLNLFGPELIVLGGGLAKSDHFLEAARRTARIHALQQAATGVSIERTALDEVGAAHGAATMVLNAVFESREHNILTMDRNGLVHGDR